MITRLYQIVTINYGEETSFANESNNIFELLSDAQAFACDEIPELPKTWLQDDPKFLTRLGELFHAGKTRIFSISDGYDMKIGWGWRTDEVDESRSEATQSLNSEIPIEQEDTSLD